MLTVKRNLHCEYGDAELNERRDELAGIVLCIARTKKAKDDSAKAFKEDLDSLAAQCNHLAVQIKARGQTREVECIVELNIPVVGIKRITRSDTGELVIEEPMTAEERQEKLPLSAA